MCSPVLHSIEGLLVGDVVHEDEAHGTPVVGCGDSSVPFLPRRVLWKRRQMREDTHKLHRVETSSAIVQSSPPEAQREVGASPETQEVRKSQPAGLH